MLIESIDFFRLDAARKLNAERRAELGQFMTPPATAKLMAAMFEAKGAELNLLDPGAGVGSLTAAFVSEVSKRDPKPRSIHVTAYEIDVTLCEYLSGALKQCHQTCDSAGNFIDTGASLVRGPQNMMLQVG